MLTLPIDEVDVSKLDLRIGKTQNRFGLKAYIFHDQQRFRVQLPEMLAPFGAGALPGYEDVFTLALSFAKDDCDSQRRTERLVRANEKLRAIDERIQYLCLQNRQLLYPKDKSNVEDHLVLGRYNSFIKNGEDGHADLISFRLQQSFISDDDRKRMSPEEIQQATSRFRHPNDVNCILMDNKMTPLDVTTENVRELIPWRSKVKAIVELAYVWVKPDKAKVIWTLSTARRISNPNEQSCSIDRDSDDEGESENRQIDGKNPTANGGMSDEADTDDEINGSMVN